MTDPLTYLTAALDAAQRDAEAAGGDAWSLGHIVIRDMVDGKATEVDRVPDGVVVGADGRGVVAAEHLGRAAAHVLRNDPASVLRRIAADRKILAEHAPGDNESGVYDSECRTCWGPDSARGECVQAKPYPCTTVRNMAEGWGWTEGERR